MSQNIITVIGSGLMGSGIAQVAAVSGQQVLLIDRSDEILQKAKDKIQWSLQKLAEKGQISEKASDIIGRIDLTTDTVGAVSNSDFIIEAVFEDIKLKRDIISMVDKHASADTVIATNSSGLSITAIADAAVNRSRIIGMHWFNPPQLSKLIEVIQSKYTSEQVLQTTLEMCRKYQKEIIRATRDVWFFLANRVRMGFSNEANLMYLNKEADFKELDAVARYKLGLPMGDFELADFTGRADNRTEGYKSANDILKEYPEFEPWPVFMRVQDYLVEELWGPMKEKGLSGIKTGKGFYEYPGNKAVKPVIPAEFAEKFEPIELLAPVVNVSAWCVTNGVGTVEDVEKSFKLAFGWPRGIFEFANELGLDKVISVLERKSSHAPDRLKEYYQVDPLIQKYKVAGIPGV